MSEIKKEQYEKIFTELEKIAKVQSVKTSNEIEGIVTSDERIIKIVNQNSDPLNHNEAEIVGYRDCLNEIHSNYKEIEFSENTILNLHEMMMKYSGDPSAGQYKIYKKIVILIDEKTKIHTLMHKIKKKNNNKS